MAKAIGGWKVVKSEAIQWVKMIVSQNRNLYPVGRSLSGWNVDLEYGLAGSGRKWLWKIELFGPSPLLQDWEMKQSTIY